MTSGAVKALICALCFFPGIFCVIDITEVTEDGMVFLEESHNRQNGKRNRKTKDLSFRQLPGMTMPGGMTQPTALPDMTVPGAMTQPTGLPDMTVPGEVTAPNSAKKIKHLSLTDLEKRNRKTNELSFRQLPGMTMPGGMTQPTGLPNMTVPGGVTAPNSAKKAKHLSLPDLKNGNRKTNELSFRQLPGMTMPGGMTQPSGMLGGMTFPEGVTQSTGMPGLPDGLVTSSIAAMKAKLLSLLNSERRKKKETHEFIFRQMPTVPTQPGGMPPIDVTIPGGMPPIDVTIPGGMTPPSFMPGMTPQVAMGTPKPPTKVQPCSRSNREKSKKKERLNSVFLYNPTIPGWHGVPGNPDVPSKPKPPTNGTSNMTQSEIPGVEIPARKLFILL